MAAPNKVQIDYEKAYDNGVVYFWNEHTEGVGYLSQWYQSPWEHEGIVYKTAEMWMMIQKAKLFGDEDALEAMKATDDPGTHKKLGRGVRGYNDKIWNNNREKIVEEGNWHKFLHSEDAAELKRQLLATGDKLLVEASPYDRIWGVGFRAANADQNRANWGLNLLGKALMRVRLRIRQMEAEETPKAKASA